MVQHTRFAVSLMLVAFAATGPSVLASPPSGPELRVRVHAPRAPAGTKVRIRYVVAPDSLQGTVQEVVAPVELAIQVTELELAVERVDRKGTVEVRLERRADGGVRGTGEGTGDRVHIRVWPTRIAVRTTPRTVGI